MDTPEIRWSQDGVKRGKQVVTDRFTETTYNVSSSDVGVHDTPLTAASWSERGIRLQNLDTRWSETEDWKVRVSIELCS